MPVVALVGNKGGAGKTTLCVNLAAALAERAPTVILDADPQGSALQWRALGNRDDAVSVVAAAVGLKEMIRVYRAGWQYIVIDCPPSVQALQTEQVLGLCDLALIPVQPSPLDIWAAVHIEDRVADARRGNSGLRAVLVINQVEPRTTLSRLMRRALAELGLPAARTAIGRRVAYRTSMLDGRSVMDLGSRGRAAADEIRQLIAEVIIEEEIRA